MKLRDIVNRIMDIILNILSVVSIISFIYCALMILKNWLNNNL